MSNSTFNRQSFISAVKARVEAEGATWVEVPPEDWLGPKHAFQLCWNAHDYVEIGDLIGKHGVKVMKMSMTRHNDVTVYTHTFQEPPRSGGQHGWY